MSQWLTLVVDQIETETSQCKTIWLVPEHGQEVSYKSGQFLTFQFLLNGKDYRRSYSLSSSPEVDDRLAITVKSVPFGIVSNYLVNTLQPGDKLSALPPTGRFVLPEIRPETKSDIFLIAAGSGITPVYGILKTLLASDNQIKVTLLYSNHDASSAIFYQKIKDLEKRYSDCFKTIFIMSEPQPNEVAIQGHLNTFMMEELAETHLNYHREEAHFYVCGPHAFMRMAYIKLGTLGFNKEFIHQEHFVIREEVKRSPIPPMEDHNEKQVTIQFDGEVHQLLVPYGKPILQAALEKNIALPYSCKGGICSSCTARCTQGEVLMSNNEVLTMRDLKNGLVLTCTGYPSTAVTLNFDQ